METVDACFRLMQCKHVYARIALEALDIGQGPALRKDESGGARLSALTHSQQHASKVRHERASHHQSSASSGALATFHLIVCVTTLPSSPVSTTVTCDGVKFSGKMISPVSCSK